MPSEPAKPKYAPPRVSLGPVLWSPQPGAPFFAALCTKSDPGAISLIVFAEESRGGSPRSGVLHVSDPRFATLTDKTAGVWDHTDESKRLAALEPRSK